MGTRNNPGEFDCYGRALPDEPLFTLLARDVDYAAVVCEWASRRLHRIARGEAPFSDINLVIEALQTGVQGSDWRGANMGKWRANSRAGGTEADREAAIEPGNIQVLRAPETMPDSVSELLDWSRQFWTKAGENDAKIDALLAEYAKELKASRG
ncbi:MAG TPA: hypothetical protein VNE67_09165 [Acetobacteraceae bacterium]|nr:hypothetical protein [Acetobacteraceae bacterium]